MRTRLSLIAVAVAAAVVSGCALKPPPAREDVAAQALPNFRVQESWVATTASPGPVADRWLASFNDPQLDALVAEALANNPDLRVAASRVEQAAAYVRLAGGTLYPQVNLIAKGSLGADSSGVQGTGLFVNWELDLWGRIRAGQQATQEQYVSAELDAWYARQSIAALVARGWFLATEARLQKALASEMVAAAERQLGLAQDRLRVGVGNEYDVTMARASLATYRDSVQSLDLADQQALRSLETLAGRYPAATVQVPAQLAPMPGPVPVGMPAELLERRPDVVAAERRVAAAFYRVEEAKAAKLPRVSLTGAVNSISSDVFVLKDRDNPVWSIGAGLLQPLFLGGQLQAQQDIRTAEQKQAIAEYGRVGANAFGEVENALSAEFNLDAREAILKQAVADNTRALELANIRYKVGSGDLRAVQQQQLALAASRTALLRVQSERLAQRVNLHLALGGSFGDRAAAPQPLAVDAVQSATTR
jgi:NodT family efflux transporter outer membrane factor (OMF) lipoprotein